MRPRAPSRRPSRRPLTTSPATEPGRRPPLLGLTGGIGSGKSAALAAFARLGAAVLSADDVVRELYADPEVAAAVRARFGAGVIDAEGAIDRARLGERAFAEPGAIAFLEALLHPRVGAARAAWRRRQEAREPRPRLLVCEVPLLFEVGAEDEFDAVLVVTASEATRRARVRARGQSFEARSARQLPEAEKVERADRAFVNDGDLGALEEWVRRCVDEYAAPA